MSHDLALNCVNKCRKIGSKSLLVEQLILHKQVDQIWLWNRAAISCLRETVRVLEEREMRMEV